MAALEKTQKEQVRSFLSLITQFPELDAVKPDGTPAWPVVRREQSLREERYYREITAVFEEIFCAGDPSRGNHRFVSRRVLSVGDKPSVYLKAGIRQGDTGLTIAYTQGREDAPTVLIGSMQAGNLEGSDLVTQGSFSFAQGFPGVTEVDLHSDPDLLTAAEDAIGRIDALTAAVFETPIARRYFDR